jgi:hypothetical protein
MRNPLSLLKLGAYSKPNLVNKKIWKFFLSRFEPYKIHAPRSVLERNPPLNKPGGHDFD